MGIDIGPNDEEIKEIEDEKNMSTEIRQNAIIQAQLEGTSDDENMENEE